MLAPDSDTARALTDSIEGLYATFAKYPLRPKMDACTCGCGAAANVLPLYSKPLRELDTEDVDYYAFSALKTMGDADDFRHFLPRIFELTANGKLLTDTEVIFGHLAYAHWEHWPAEEQEAIRAYFMRIWKHGVETPPDPDPYGWTHMDDWICAIALVEPDLSVYLETWSRAKSFASVANLARLVRDHREDLAGNKVPEGFWANAEPGWAQLRNWLLSSTVTDNLARSRSAFSVYGLGAEINDALEILSAKARS